MCSSDLFIQFLSPGLQAACAEGALYMLTVPQLQLLSRVSLFPNSPTSLLCSPDWPWVFVSTPHSDLGPKVSSGAVFLAHGTWLCARKVAGPVP